MFFKQLKIAKWQQFEDMDITFHDRITILTGANGSGKTTILNLLARHIGWEHITLATPKRSSVTGIISWFARLFNGEDRSGDSFIGELRYSNGSIARLLIQPSNSAQYQLSISDQQTVKCFYIPSHRSVFRYQQLSNIPAAKKDKLSAFQEVFESSKQRYIGGKGQSHSFFMKNTLIGWAINGYGVKSDSKTIMPSDEEQVRHFEGFQTTLKQILPKSLKFKEFEIRNMEVVFVCNDGKDEFILETASGGVSALIDMAWHIYMYSTKENQQFTVLIDEVENHLHPTMQRTVLEDLSNAFPGVRFIVATHSPLIVGSVRESLVYALRYNENGKIVSQKLELQDMARTATEILDEVLDVSSSLPVWAENELVAILRKFSQRTMDRKAFEEMRSELSQAGLEKLMPRAIESAVAQASDQNK